MRKFLTIAICVGMMATLLVGVAGAGLNSAAVAHLYWMSAASASGTPLAARNSVAATAQCLVTLTGMASARGADVQLIISGLDTQGFPVCWQNGAYTGKIGGWRTTATTVTAYAPLLATAGDGGAVPGVIAVKDGSAIDFEDPVNPSFTPNHCGLAWYSAAGSSGKTRNVAKEYAVFGFVTTPSTDPLDQCAPVCIGPNWRLGAGAHDTFWVMQVSDATNATDFIPFLSTQRTLVYGDANLTAGCPEVITPANATTWGKVKKLYR